MENERKVLIYSRSAERNDKALQQQTDSLFSYAKEHEFMVIGFVEEFGSGIDATRPGIEKLKNYIETYKDISYVLVKDISRISRDSEFYSSFLDYLSSKNVELICSTGAETYKKE